MISRATVLNALFNLLGTVPGFQTVGRRLTMAVEQVQQPAMFMRLVSEKRAPLQGYGLPQETTLDVEIWMYVTTPNPPGGPDVGDETHTPESVITPLLDALDTTLLTNTTFDGRQTLGLEGYVTHAWIEGETTVAQGEQGNQAIMIVPMRIQVNAQMGTT